MQIDKKQLKEMIRKEVRSAMSRRLNEQEEDEQEKDMRFDSLKKETDDPEELADAWFDNSFGAMKLRQDGFSADTNRTWQVVNSDDEGQPVGRSFGYFEGTPRDIIEHLVSKGLHKRKKPPTLAGHTLFKPYNPPKIKKV